MAVITVLSLPPEILSQIFSNLNPFDLASVAKTFNRQFYHAALQVLKPSIPWMQNAQRMCSLFSTSREGLLMPSFPGHIGTFSPDWTHRNVDIPTGDCERFGLNPAKSPYVRCSPPDLRSWMKLDGTFDWLEPLDEKTAKQMGPHTGPVGARPVAPDWKVDDFIKQTERLGLTLPQGFDTFLRSEHLHYRIPSSSAWYFYLDGIIECPSCIDGGAGGYLVRFYFDQQYCAFSHLYMNKSGNHCILYTDIDLYSFNPAAWGDEDSEQSNRVSLEEMIRRDYGEDHDVRDEIPIVGVTFEEYLASVYFEELLNFRAPPSKALREYVAHVYRPAAEVKPMREYNTAIKSFFDEWQRRRKNDIAGVLGDESIGE
ncbi:hypothetical protein SAPIO_CDS2319 [Scedosporium apiospermum]|uniref:F-box domain-containing protein n=1 Tax=Pseudallescheria apiosperma TaxID=563466 RepID=A0A084GC87_PSEDA|nr:uncharacterized protein SAPIO_CDS2319 [Scedosporium apiospermum]KEZ44949.1 hypothetical protein SAPIO_CDS2319 [Scedosporium apiospermum]